MAANVIWKNGATPERFGCTYLCCQRHQARLIAPAIAWGDLLRRLNHAPISATLIWPNGTSAVKKKKLLMCTHLFAKLNLLLETSLRNHTRLILNFNFTNLCHSNVLDRMVHGPLGYTQLDSRQMPFLLLKLLDYKTKLSEH